MVRECGPCKNLLFKKWDLLYGAGIWPIFFFKMLECSWKECVCVCMYFVSSILHFHFNLSWFFCFIFNVYYLKQKLSAIALPYKDKISIFQIPWSLSSASALTLHRHALWPPWHHSEIVWPFSVLSYFRYMFFLFFSLVWGFFFNTELY